MLTHNSTQLSYLLFKNDSAVNDSAKHIVILGVHSLPFIFLLRLCFFKNFVVGKFSVNIIFRKKRKTLA